MDSKRLITISVIAALSIAVFAAGIFFYIRTKADREKSVILTEDRWRYDTDFEERKFMPHSKLEPNNGVTDDERLWYAISGQIMRTADGDNYVVYLQHFDTEDPKSDDDGLGVNFYLETTFIQPKKKVKAGVENQIILYKYDLGTGSDWYIYTKPTGYFMVTEAAENQIKLSLLLTFTKRQHPIKMEEQNAELKMEGTVILKRGKGIKIEPMPSK